MRLNRSTYNAESNLPEHVVSKVFLSTHSKDNENYNVDGSDERKLVEKVRRAKVQKRRMIRRRQIDLNQI